ncbi:hypothetical protein [Nocardia mexicana]|uniref:hypothetical protein n=1 Tax=Nocardia mexicana TaxID=279262 RepID=UPI0011C02EC2|nr:hypothetical protein [Nocardia mexicana]
MAEWLLHGGYIRILLVRKQSSAEALVSLPLASAPDLVEVREDFPHLALLWDEVHNHFWNTFGRQVDGATDAFGRRVR